MNENRLIILALIAGLFCASLQIPLSAQTVSGATGNVTFNADNSDGDDSDKILIGVAITMVVVLLLVGWKMDRNGARYADLQESIDSAVASTYESTFTNDPLVVDGFRL